MELNKKIELIIEGGYEEYLKKKIKKDKGGEEGFGKGLPQKKHRKSIGKRGSDIPYLGRMTKAAQERKKKRLEKEPDMEKLRKPLKKYEEDLRELETVVTEQSEKELMKYLGSMKGKKSSDIVKGLMKKFGLGRNDAERALELVEELMVEAVDAMIPAANILRQNLKMTSKFGGPVSVATKGNMISVNLLLKNGKAPPNLFPNEADEIHRIQATWAKGSDKVKIEVSDGVGKVSGKSVTSAEAEKAMQKIFDKAKKVK